MAEPLSIENLCEAFDRSWRAGTAVRIESLLECVADAQRNQLLQSLLEIELEYRLKSADKPSLTEYVQRFPQDAVLIKAAYDESKRRLAPSIAPELPETVLGPGDNCSPSEESSGDVITPRIEGYTIHERLGAGALGVVFKATQLGTNRVVAIKSIRPELETNGRVRQLFIREASIATQLKHPRIVDSIGFGFAGERPWLAMEYVPTIDLESVVLQHNPQRRVRLAVKVARNLLEGLQHAHQLGIVHRDIKLANVLAFRQSNRLRVKISDFGLAKVFLTAGHSGITDSGDICGTLAYMSPEQIADSRRAGPDCDIYAALVCLFRLLTGQFPHPQGSAAEIIYHRAHQTATPVRRLNAAVSDELARIIDLGLSRHREVRFQSADQLLTALQEVPDLIKTAAP